MRSFNYKAFWENFGVLRGGRTWRFDCTCVQYILYGVFFHFRLLVGLSKLRPGLLCSRSLSCHATEPCLTRQRIERRQEP